MSNIEIGIPLKDLDLIDLAEFKICNFLVNVLSDMYGEFQKWESASIKTPEFIWHPNATCLFNHGQHLEEFHFGELIWSTYSYINLEGIEKTVTEPFACIFQSKINGKAYLVFRGSKSVQDFLADREIVPVPYFPPTGYLPLGIEIAKGWSTVYEGLRDALRDGLQTLGTPGNRLTITGHSLGSALATLAVPEAISLNFNVQNLNTASPRVGLSLFKTYYESLRVDRDNIPGCLKTIRVINNSDSVPTLPPLIFGYEHVGLESDFTATYDGGESVNHDPCCCYAYALEYPENPINPSPNMCHLLK